MDTLIPAVRVWAWYVRVFDFPRAQIASLGLLLGGLSGWLLTLGDWFTVLSLFALGLALVWHAVIIVRFTPLAPKRALPATKGDVRDRIRLMNENVCQDNRDASKLLDLVEEDSQWRETMKRQCSASALPLRHPAPIMWGALVMGLWSLGDPIVRHAHAVEVEWAGGVSPEQLRKSLGEPARFGVDVGDPNAPREWRYWQRDPDTWTRSRDNPSEPCRILFGPASPSRPEQDSHIGDVRPDLDGRGPAYRNTILSVKFQGSLYNDETYTLPAGTVFHVTDHQIEVLSKLTTLRNLELIKAGVTPEQLKTLSSHPTLESLILEGSNVTNEGLRWVGKMKELRSLAIRGEPIDGTGLKHLARLPKLVAFELAGRVDDDTLAGLSGLSSVRFLDLTGQMTDLGLAQLAPLKSLNALRVGRSNVEGTGLKHLCPDTLRKLQLWTRMSDEGLIAVGRFHGLRKLDCSDSPVSDKGIEGLRDIHKLEWLVARHTNINGAGLEHLMGLRWLELGDSKTTSESLKFCAGLVHLEYLGLERTRIDGNCLKRLRGLRNLVDLNVRRTAISNDSIRYLDSLVSLRWLDLRGCTAIDDGAAPFLGRLTSLVSLDLRDTQITENALPHLHELSKLRRLCLPLVSENMEDSKVLNNLRLALPQCTIGYSERLASSR